MREQLIEVALCESISSRLSCISSIAFCVASLFDISSETREATAQARIYKYVLGVCVCVFVRVCVCVCV